MNKEDVYKASPWHGAYRIESELSAEVDRLKKQLDMQQKAFDDIYRAALKLVEIGTADLSIWQNFVSAVLNESARREHSRKG